MGEDWIQNILGRNSKTFLRFKCEILGGIQGKMSSRELV